MALIYVESLWAIVSLYRAMAQKGAISSKAISLPERVFGELGCRLKRIAWGWPGKVVTNLSKMIILEK